MATRLASGVGYFGLAVATVVMTWVWANATYTYATEGNTLMAIAAGLLYVVDWAIFPFIAPAGHAAWPLPDGTPMLPHVLAAMGIWLVCVIIASRWE